MKLILRIIIIQTRRSRERRMRELWLEMRRREVT